VECSGQAYVHPEHFKQRRQNLEANWGPWSDTIVLGSP
jgi:hypothetical protein